MENNEEIRQYWQNRARELGSSTAVTTQDVHLRELEIATLRSQLENLNLPPGSRVVDIGCGDGHSTLKVAKSLKTLSFKAMDFSSNMIDVARERLEQNPELKERVSFEVGDVTDLRSCLSEGSVDVVTTDRCLINLTSGRQQYDALAEIHRALKPGGHYVGIEDFQEGNDELNRLRESLGLPKIAVRWHNLFFRQAEFLQQMKCLFSAVEIIDFASSYYFATRVVYSKCCQLNNVQPDYHHEVHQLAGDIPNVGSVSPLKLIVMAKQ